MLTGTKIRRDLPQQALALVLVFLSVTETVAQTNLSSIRLTLDIQNQPLPTALQIISQKSGLSFSYNPKKIPSTNISLSSQNETLISILNKLSLEHELKYMMVENQIILKPDKKPTAVKSTTAPPVATISGYIKDEDSGEPLIGATVLVKSHGAGTTTNAYGYYSLSLPKGTYETTYSYVGFTSQVKSIDLQTSILHEIKLKEFAPVLQEVIITGSPSSMISEIQASKNNILASTVEQRPAFFGEMDVVKSLESLPGIKFHSDGSTFYYVRGGNRDQNLLLIDEAPIYNPSHMLGVFSTIIPDAVNDVNVFKGDMPASLGGRLSSVMEVRTKKGNDQHLSAWGNFGLISTKLGVEGPFKKNASSFLVSTRLSRLKWFFQSVTDNINEFDFSDLNAKMNFRLNPSNRLFFSFYTGNDNYFADNTGIEWRNTAGTFRWNHLFGDRIFLNTTLAAAGYDYFLHTDVRTNTKWNSHVSNVTFKNDLSWFIRPGNELTMGLALNGYGFNPGNLSSDLPLPQSLTLSVKNAVELVLYANHEIALGEKTGLNYGLRLSHWTTTGEAFEFQFDDNHEVTDTLYFAEGQGYQRYVNLEPRLTLRYQLNESSSVKTSYSRNVQNVHLITNSVSPFTSLDVWLPSSINIQPQKSNQFTLGYYREVKSLGATFSAELFHKKMTNQIEYEAHPETLLNPTMEGELRFGIGRAYGLELLLKKDEGRLRGWIGYTWSRAKRQFNEVNEGKTFNAIFDRPHQVNLTTSYDASLRWNVGVNWIYSTGSPYTAPIGYYSFNGQEVPLYGEKNNERLPDYHRMDLSATWKLNRSPEKKYQHNLTFSIYNLYGRKNPLFINYNKSENAEGEFRIPSNLIDAQRETSQYYLFSVIPSVSYNFKWR
jgi:hypothetical protein